MMLLLCLRFHIMGWNPPQFKPEDNPAAFSPLWSTRAMTYSYIYAFNMVLLLCPSTLSYDWQMGSIPLLQQLTDIRNLASLSLFVSLLLITRYCLQKNKVKLKHNKYGNNALHVARHIIEIREIQMRECKKPS